MVMKTATMFFIRLYFRVLSVLWPEEASKKAFRLFQRTLKLPFKKAEQEFYEQARKFDVVHPAENVHAYEVGNPKGKLVILVHGWNSNAGSMGAIANTLARNNYRVVALDLPAHGYSTLTHTNLRECREALCALIYQLRPSEPFSVVSHSFGSAVATMALSGTRYTIDNFIMLTSPNRLIDVFDEFKNQIALGEQAYQEVLLQAHMLLKEPLENVQVETKALNVNYNKIVLLHDENDKILPYSNSVRLGNVLPNAQLITLKKMGHYRMLWNETVLRKVLFEIEPEMPVPSYMDEYITELLSA
jgi:pimeloyl-ACP methyl ester carboxylesterase